MSPLKPILVIGATGAQGYAVIHALVSPAPDGSPSPYCVRALTRDPSGKRAAELSALPNVQLFKGSFLNLDDVQAALEGMYGAFVNTDGFAVAEQMEIFCAMRIYELAFHAGLKHFVWSSIPYYSKERNFDPRARCAHADGKGRVADWIRSMPSTLSDGMSWTIIDTGLYYEMLNIHMGGPLITDDDGTVVFAYPLGDGKLEMTPLTDLAFYTRHVFDNREKSSGKTLTALTDGITGQDVVDAFVKVTGKKARFKNLSFDEWISCFPPGITDSYMSGYQEHPDEGAKYHVLTVKENFGGWWYYQSTNSDSKADRQYQKEVPHTMQSLESWMRAVNYTGARSFVLKTARSVNGWPVNREIALRLVQN